MSRNRFKCLDCQTDTGKTNEYYMLTDEIWNSINPGGAGMLCIGCVENRLGRELHAEDFIDCFLNNPKHNNMSIRLLSRIRNTAP